MQARSLPSIVTDIVNQLASLVRKEAQLARVEMSEKITQVAVGLGLIVVGAVLLIPALVILLQAGVAGLVEAGMKEPWAALFVGGAVLLIGIILALIGTSRLKADRLLPDKTIHQVQRDISVARNQVRQSYDEQRAA
jgi:Putative Actinobacterial Holin-X, holin superfamily III